MLTNNPSLCKKNLFAHMKVPHVELFRAAARLVPRYAVTADLWEPKKQDAENVFCAPDKKEQGQGKIL